MFRKNEGCFEHPSKGSIRNRKKCMKQPSIRSINYENQPLIIISLYKTKNSFKNQVRLDQWETIS